MDKTKLANLKALAFKFLNFGNEAPEPQKFEAVKIKDGETMVEFDPELSIGSPVMVSSGTGSVAADDQTFEFENGISFVVKDGLIESVISDGKQDPAKEEPAKTNEELSGEVVTREEYDSLLARIEALENKAPQDFSHLPTKTQLNEFTEHLKNVGNVIEELSAIPMETPESVLPNAEQAREQSFSNVASHFTKK